MSIDIEVKLIVGMRYSDLVECLHETEVEALDEDLESGEIDYASPYYDSSRRSWYVGYEVLGGNNFNQNLEQAKTNFSMRFLIEPEIIITPHVY